MLACTGDPVTAARPVTSSVSRSWPGELGQNWTCALQLCPGINVVVQVFDGTL
jgi:hypothetical protein